MFTTKEQVHSIISKVNKGPRTMLVLLFCSRTLVRSGNSTTKPAIFGHGKSSTCSPEATSHDGSLGWVREVQLKRPGRISISTVWRGHPRVCSHDGSYQRERLALHLTSLWNDVSSQSLLTLTHSWSCPWTPTKHLSLTAVLVSMQPRQTLTTIVVGAVPAMRPLNKLSHPPVLPFHASFACPVRPGLGFPCLRAHVVGHCYLVPLVTGRTYVVVYESLTHFPSIRFDDFSRRCWCGYVN